MEITEVQQPGETLQRNEENLRLFVSEVKDYAIFMLDPSGVVTTWNEGAERIKGYTAEEIIGKNVSEFYTPEAVERGQPLQELNIAKEMGRHQGEGWRVRKDGSRFWADVVVTAVRDEVGRLRGFGKVTRDVTERNLAAEALRLSEENLRLFVSEVKDYAIFMLDPSGVVTTWNEGAERIKGYTAEEIIGKNFSEFYTPEAAEKGQPLQELNIAKQIGRYQEEGWRVRKDGSRFWADVVITAVRDEAGRLRGFGKVTRNLTERRHQAGIAKKRSKISPRS
jgi:PAS domain S-box-containing protein